MPGAVTIDTFEEEVNSSSDEEFDPAVQPDHDTSASSDSNDDNDDAQPSDRRPKKATKKRKQPNAEPDLDSGDEATIRERKKKRRKKAKSKRADDHDEDASDSSDDDGAGGLIKTRSQRRAETKERRPLATLVGARGNVDAIWARMNAPRREDVPPGSVLQEVPEARHSAVQDENLMRATKATDSADFITIKRTYEFAGELKTEERRVPRHSEEARVYLESQATKKKKKDPDPDNLGETQTESGRQEPAVRRPLKRISRFEANPTGHVRALPDKLQLRWPRTTDEDGNLLAGMQPSQRETGVPRPPKQVKIKPADKLTTVDKSRMDWAGFVDKEGIAEELDKYGKAKENFVERGQLLARLDERRGEQGRQARVRSQA